MEKNNNILGYTGSNYEGDIKNERMEGNGTYTFASGLIKLHSKNLFILKTLIFLYFKRIFETLGGQK